MAAGNSSFELFLSNSIAEDVKVDVDTIKKMNCEINKLRLALKASEDALVAERQQKVKDRKLYEAKISEYRQRCIDYCEKMKEENDIKLKALESDEKDKRFQVSVCDQSSQALPSVDKKCIQTMQPYTTNH